jgi:tetratricopeptide (TPR) repeat protein
MSTNKINAIKAFVKLNPDFDVSILSSHRLRIKSKKEQAGILVDVAKEKVKDLIAARSYHEAEAVAEQALKLEDDFRLKQFLVIVKMYLNKMMEAKKICLENIKKHDLAEDYNNLSLIERSLKNFKASYKAGKKAYKKKPKFGSIVANFAITAMVCDKPKEAFEAIEKALELDPNCAMFYANKASMLCDMKKYEEAESVFEKCIALNPREHQIYMDYFYCLANQKKYKKAWPNYENRYDKIKELKQNIKMLNKPVMYYKKPHYDEKICVIPEQGAGDIIMFLRFLPEFQKRAPNSYFFCNDNIYQFAKHLPIRITNTFDESSTHVMGIMSLPFHLGVSNIPPPISPVHHLPNKSDKLKVGICWAGSAFHPMDWQRSTYLKWWEPFLLDESMEIYSFMKDKRSRIYTNSKQTIDYSEGFENYKIIDLSDNLSSAYETAEQLNKIDVLVTIDSFIAHLAGTCGVPVHLMVSEKHDWRWGPTQRHSEWYPSIEIYRRRKSTSYEQLINKIHKKLKDERQPPVL